MKQFLLVTISIGLLTLPTAIALHLVQPKVISEKVRRVPEKDPDRFDSLVMHLLRLQKTDHISPNKLKEIKNELKEAIRQDREDLSSLPQLELENEEDVPAEVHYEQNEHQEQSLQEQVGAFYNLHKM